MIEKTTKELSKMFHSSQNITPDKNDINNKKLEYVYTVEEHIITSFEFKHNNNFNKYYKNLRTNIPKDHIKHVSFIYTSGDKENVYYSMYDIFMKIHELYQNYSKISDNDFHIIPSLLSRGIPIALYNRIKMEIHLYDEYGSEYKIMYDIYEEVDILIKDIYGKVDDSIPDELVQTIYNYIPCNIIEFKEQINFYIHKCACSSYYRHLNFPTKYFIIQSQIDYKMQLDKLYLVFADKYSHSFNLLDKYKYRDNWYYVYDFEYINLTTIIDIGWPIVDNSTNIYYNVYINLMTYSCNMYGNLYYT